MNTLNQKKIQALINEGNFNEVVTKCKKIVKITLNNYKTHNNLECAFKEIDKFEDNA